MESDVVGWPNAWRRVTKDHDFDGAQVENRVG